MKRYQLFLAYYTLIVTIVLFVWSIFYAPKPQGFFLSLLIVPIGIYFWLLVGGAPKPQSSNSSFENHERNIKFPLIVLMTLFISSFSIFLYSIISNPSRNSEPAFAPLSKQVDSLRLELENQNKTFREEIGKEFGGIKNQLINMKIAQDVTGDAGTLGDTTALAGTVTINDKKYPTINVYTEKSTSSATIGKAEFGKTYTFIEKDQDWYLILLGAKEGFISSQFVKEVQY